MSPRSTGSSATGKGSAEGARPGGWAPSGGMTGSRSDEPFAPLGATAMTAPLLPMHTTAEQPDDLHPDIEGVLVSHKQIAAKVRELAGRIDDDYAGREVMLVGVLKGAVMVMADPA